MKGVLGNMIWKETLHVVRDRRTVFVIFFIPIVLLLLFGFAISTEVNTVRVMVVAENHTDQTRAAVERLRENSYFDFQGFTVPQSAQQQLRGGHTDAVLFLRTDRGAMECQIMVDASNTNIAQAATIYLQNVAEGTPASSATIRTLYNPQLKSAYNFVPGIMGMIFILICAMMTSVSIVREKEEGSMDLLLVSPVKPATIIVGKLVPYFLLSCAILAAILAVAYTLLGLPLSASLINVVWVSLLYIILSLSIGLFVSTMVDTQLSALIVSAVVFMIPILMFSGMIYPIDNMPQPLQWFSTIIPARWYISAMRKLMIQHLTLQYVVREIAVMLGMTALILMLSIRKFKQR